MRSSDLYRSVTPTIAKPSSPESIPSTISDHVSRPGQEETSRLLLYDRRIGIWREKRIALETVDLIRRVD
jgi:hypothetical protein